MKIENMNVQNTAGFLATMNTYWPNSNVVEGMAESWAMAFKGYTNLETWEALKDYRSEEDRKFAPTISEIIGRMDYYRKRKVEEQENEALLLEGPRRKNDFEPIETYTYKTSRTTPKRKPDEPDWEVRKAVRCSRERKKELLEEMRKRGYIKRYYDLADGKKGSVWVK